MVVVAAQTLGSYSALLLRNVCNIFLHKWLFLLVQLAIGHLSLTLLFQSCIC